MLCDLYVDKDGERKQELSIISGPDEFAEFYARLDTIQAHYHRHPNEIAIPLQVELAELANAYDSADADQPSLLVEFSDEEGFGRYLDLHECHSKYLNLRNVEKHDYITYLMEFDHVFDIPKERKNMDYKRYVDALIEYLCGFVGRTRPLLDLDAEMERVRGKFQRQWEAGQFPGWPKEHGSAMVHDGAHLDLSAFANVGELATLGLDRLKSALMALGIRCGGTLEERADRLFSTKGTAELDPSLMVKKSQSRARQNAHVALRGYQIAGLEAKLYRLAELVAEHRAATKENVQRKQARTDAERDDSDAEASEAEPDDDGDTDDVPYNPKNLPLGWDGRPIPYWLYKLHGLNLNYSCEICGNFTYKGPKAFQHHFAEWRHAHGMRCLGIPNTAHFANVTQIEDAITRMLHLIEPAALVVDHKCLLSVLDNFSMGESKNAEAGRAIHTGTRGGI